MSATYFYAGEVFLGEIKAFINAELSLGFYAASFSGVFAFY